jgi:hypothetical protein
VAKFKKVRSLADIKADPRVASVHAHDEGIIAYLMGGWCNGLEGGGGTNHHDCVHSFAEGNVTDLKRMFNLFVQPCDCADGCKE